MIDEFIRHLEKLDKLKVEELPISKTLVLMAEGFKANDLPLSHLGKIQIDINESFFEDENRAKKIIDLYCKLTAKIRRFFIEKFGEEIGNQIWSEMLSQQSLTYKI